MKEREITEKIIEYEKRLEDYNDRDIQIEIAVNLYALTLHLKSLVDSINQIPIAMEEFRK